MHALLTVLAPCCVRDSVVCVRACVCMCALLTVLAPCCARDSVEPVSGSGMPESRSDTSDSTITQNTLRTACSNHRQSSFFFKIKTFLSNKMN